MLCETLCMMQAQDKNSQRQLPCHMATWLLVCLSKHPQTKPASHEPLSPTHPTPNPLLLWTLIPVFKPPHLTILTMDSQNIELNPRSFPSHILRDPQQHHRKHEGP